jgi:hypothetical protein
MSLLAQIAIFLAAAVVAIPIFRRFKLGSVLGYLAAGIIIGPACFGLISRIPVEVLKTLGLSELKANETVQRFRAHDEATLLRQHAVRDDEKKLIQTGRESAEQLLQLFETDTDQPEEEAARTGT